MTTVSRVVLAQAIADDLHTCRLAVQVDAQRQRILREGAGLTHVLVVLPDGQTTRLGAVLTDARTRCAPEQPVTPALPQRHQRPVRRDPWRNR